MSVTTHSWLRGAHAIQRARDPAISEKLTHSNPEQLDLRARPAYDSLPTISALPLLHSVLLS
jgi:hypothetical protein